MVPVEGIKLNPSKDVATLWPPTQQITSGPPELYPLPIEVCMPVNLAKKGLNNSIIKDVLSTEPTAAVLKLVCDVALEATTVVEPAFNSWRWYCASLLSVTALNFKLKSFALVAVKSIIIL